MVELVDATQEYEFKCQPRKANDDRRNEQGRPVANSKMGQQQPRAKGAHHILGAVRDIDDVEETEDDGEPENSTSPWRSR